MRVWRVSVLVSSVCEIRLTECECVGVGVRACPCTHVRVFDHKKRVSRLYGESMSDYLYIKISDIDIFIILIFLAVAKFEI